MIPKWSLWAYKLKELLAFPSLSQRQIALIWLPWPGLAVRPSSKRVYSSCMFCCSPILLSLLQHCIWKTNGAFDSVVCKWCAFPSPLRSASNSSDLAALARFGTSTLFQARLLLLYVCCSPILLSSLQPCFYGLIQWFDNVVQDWHGYILPQCANYLSCWDILAIMVQ